MARKKVKKIKWSEMCALISQHNDQNKVIRQFGDKDPLICVVVFKNESWPNRNYSLKARSYEFRSDNKRFVPGLCGGSIFADCLDGSDPCVRLDYLLGDWIIDYCYIKER